MMACRPDNQINVQADQQPMLPRPTKVSSPSLRTIRPMAIAASTSPPSLLRYTTEAWRFADTTANVRSSPGTICPRIQIAGMPPHPADEYVGCDGSAGLTKNCRNQGGDNAKFHGDSPDMTANSKLIGAEISRH